MTTFVLISGELFREPQAKVSKAGKDYCAATLRTVDGAEILYWSIVAFGSAGEELGSLGAGEAVACQGKLKVGVYEKDGVTKSSFSISTNNVLPLRAPKKVKVPKQAEVRKNSAESAEKFRTPAPAAAWDDPWPSNMGGPSQ